MKLDTAITMAGLSLRFGLVHRATAHADGCTPESDTTHTHMLSMLVLEQAQAEGLDPLLCCALVQVHDLPEVGAGDTDTAFGLTDEQRLDSASSWPAPACSSCSSSTSDRTRARPSWCGCSTRSRPS